MKFKNITTKRRGLSSIVGALLFVVLMVSAFAVIGVALDSQTDIASTGRDVAAKDLEKQQESFVFNSVQQGPNPADYLEIELTNTGQNTAEMFTVIMTNKSDIGEPTRTFEIPSVTSFLPVGDTTPTNVVSTLDLKMDIPPLVTDPPEDYEFKVISSLGTVKTISIQCQPPPFSICGIVTPPAPPGTPGLSAQLFLDGPTGVNGKVSTVIMFVQNTGSVPLEDVRPVDEACIIGTYPTLVDGGDPIPGLGDFICSPLTPPADNACGSAIPVPPGNNDGTGVCLGPGQMAIYKWDGVVEGDVGDVFTFCNEAVGELYDDTPLPPTATTCDTLEVINPNDCNGAICDFGGGDGGESIILIDDLLIKPSIFMTIPSPFGDTTDADDELGLWGVNVANPTDQDMTISKVTIVAFPPGGNANDVVFNGIKSGQHVCKETDVLPLLGPSPGGFWDCPRDNTVMWQNFASPLLLRANSTESFMLKVEPGGIFVENQNLDALIVQANVYSTFGSFGKAGYQSTMYDNESPIVNVYLQNATATADLRDGFIGNINDIANYTTGTYTAVLADLDDNDGTFINTGAKFVINVPREWTEVTLVDCEGFEDVGTPTICDGPNEPTVTIHSDGSTQIIGTSIAPIGDGATADFTDPEEAKKITFTAKAAAVKAPRLFIMYILADGIITTTDGDRTIGPLAEVVLNVDP